MNCKAIGYGSACVLTLGLVFGLATVGAVADDSAPNSPGERDQMPVTSAVDGHDAVDNALTSEAEITIVVAAPLTACCKPQPEQRRVPRSTCVSPMSSDECLAGGGVPMRTCRLCAVALAPAGSEEEESGTTEPPQDDKPYDSSSVDGLNGAAWTLLVAAMILASL